VKRLAVLFLAASSACAPSTTSSPGRAKAQACSVCHGPLGISNAPDAPHLAGQPRIYFMEQLKAFRSGKRAHPVMNVIAKPLTDADISNLADWYSSLKIEVREKR
jgi:cytochrome c553